MRKNEVFVLLSILTGCSSMPHKGSTYDFPSKGEGAKIVVTSVEEPDVMKLRVKFIQISCDGSVHEDYESMESFLNGLEKEKYSKPQECRK